MYSPFATVHWVISAPHVWHLLLKPRMRDDAFSELIVLLRETTTIGVLCVLYCFLKSGHTIVVLLPVVVVVVVVSSSSSRRSRSTYRYCGSPGLSTRSRASRAAYTRGFLRMSFFSCLYWFFASNLDVRRHWLQGVYFLTSPKTCLWATFERATFFTSWHFLTFCRNLKTRLPNTTPCGVTSICHNTHMR